MDRVILSEPLYRQIACPVTQAVPMEAVGRIGDSPDGRALLVIEIPNLTGPHEFFADPFAQYQAKRRIYEEWITMIAIYHSHPGGGTSLSDADRMTGARWNCAHIVIVPERSPDDSDYLRAWRIFEEEPREIPVLRECR